MTERGGLGLRRAGAMRRLEERSRIVVPLGVAAEGIVQLLDEHRQDSELAHTQMCRGLGLSINWGRVV